MVLDPQTGALSPADPAKQNQDHGQKSNGQVQTCPFAALAFAAPAPSPVALPPARAPPERIFAPSSLITFATFNGPPLPARGPPFHA
jgi:hypothetical protein